MQSGFCFRMKRLLNTFVKADGGIAALEFALVGGPFFMILGVMLETALMFYTEYALQIAVHDASRIILTGQAVNSNQSAAQFKTNICSLANLLIDCTNKVTVYVRSDSNYANLAANTPSVLTIGPQTSVNMTPAPTCYNPGNPSQPAIIVATYDWNFVNIGMSAFANTSNTKMRRLVGLNVFQNEPFSGGSAATC